MAKLIITRYHFDATFTAGIATLDGKFVGWVLEDVVRVLKSAADKVPGKTAIPKGTYKVSVTMSNRFKRKMCLVENVPYFAGIRIHGGNTSADTEGCLLIARNWKGLGMIQGSMEKDLTAMCERGDFNEIEIREAR